MPELSKLQIRAKVLSSIAEMKTIKFFSPEKLADYIKDFEEVSDKKSLIDIFIKEFIKLEEKEYTVCGCLIKQVIPEDVVNEKVMEYLQNKTLSDESKYKLVQLLRIIGSKVDYTQLPACFEHPQDVFDSETKRLLENAVFNPESMLDFLDFVSAVSAKDRNLLLKSLTQDYQGDVLANIVYPILYSDFDDEFKENAIKTLSESKSSIAIEPFEYIIETNSNQNLVNLCKTGLKKLKLAGATKEKADKYFADIIKTSIPAQFAATIPDGNGTQAILSTRIAINDKFIMIATVISDTEGIVDCFGFFNISHEEIIRIADKFYLSEGKYIIKPEYAKAKIKEAIDLTIKLKRTFPYEFICWNTFLKDIKLPETSLDEFINENVEMLPIKKEEATVLMTRDFTLRWFISPNDNSTLKDIIKYIYETEDITIDDINAKIRENFSNIFDDRTTNNWKNRFLNLIYLLYTNKKEKEAQAFLTMYKDEKLFHIFQMIIIQRSIFNHFVMLKENAKESFFTTNIFKKKSNKENEYSVKRLEHILNILQKRWING